MKRFLFVVVCALAVAGMLVLGWGWWRTRDARNFSARRMVHTFDGTNYVFQLCDVTVGRVHTGFVVIVAARMENPNQFPVELQRDWFVLVFRPSGLLGERLAERA